MKKFLGILLALAVAFSCIALVACVDKKEEEQGDVAVAVVTLDKDKAELKVGGTLELKATVSPDNATDKTVTWSTSAEAVATVENGKVTAVSAGTATITAKAGDKSATCEVTVKEAVAKVIALDGVGNGTDKNAVNGYTISKDITVSYDDATKTIKLTGKSWYVAPWFNTSWTGYNYITVGVLLSDNFVGKTVDAEGGKSVYASSILRYDVSAFNAEAGDVWEEENVSYWKTTVSGDGTTPLATSGDAAGYFDFSFAANSANTVKDNLFKFKVVFNENDEAVIYTVDISGLELIASEKPAE